MSPGQIALAERPTLPDVTDPTSYAAVTLESSEALGRYNRWIVDSIAASMCGRTLEIGAGIGTMSVLVRAHCTELVLVEPAANLCESLTARFADDPNVTTRCGLLADVVEQDHEAFATGFDTIVSFNVLEHVEDDVGMLKLSASMLRPGGRLCLFVPSGPALYGTLDRQVNHFRRYTRDGLTGVLNEAGLTPQRMQYFDLVGAVPWFLVGRVLKRNTTGAGAGWYDRLVIPVAKVVDRLSGPPRGKNLLAVAAVTG